MKTKTPEKPNTPDALQMERALKKIITEGTKTPANLHDVQVQRYSKWAVEIAKAALAQ